ncbi:MAG: hypothetical protein K1V67_09350, partial [Paramuribaculum intestinale]
MSRLSLSPHSHRQRRLFIHVHSQIITGLHAYDPRQKRRDYHITSLQSGITAHRCDSLLHSYNAKPDIAHRIFQLDPYRLTIGHRTPRSESHTVVKQPAPRLISG